MKHRLGTEQSLECSLEIPTKSKHDLEANTNKTSGKIQPKTLSLISSPRFNTEETLQKHNLKNRLPFTV